MRIRKTLVLVSGVAFLPGIITSLPGDEAPDQHAVAFFEKRIRPVLAEHCYECHSDSAKEIGGGLRLDSRASTRIGGDSGRVIVVGNPNKSLLIAALRHEVLQMPPDGKLPDHVIADFIRWIEIGAPDPRDDERRSEKPGFDIEAARDFWSFRPLSEVEGSIDHLAVAKLFDASLAANPPADKYTLLRRLFFDLAIFFCSLGFR